MALRLTQPLTEMSTRNNSWRGKGGRCLGLTTLPPKCADCLEPLVAKAFWNHLGGPVQVCDGVALPFYWDCSVDGLTALKYGRPRNRVRLPLADTDRLLPCSVYTGSAEVTLTNT